MEEAVVVWFGIVVQTWAYFVLQSFS